MLSPLLRSFLLLAILTIAGFAGSAAQAAGPSVWILRPPAAYHAHHQTYSYYPATGYGVSTPNYAYGWFGATPRTTVSRHFGYYRHYTQWTFK